MEECWEYRGSCWVSWQRHCGSSGDWRFFHTSASKFQPTVRLASSWILASQYLNWHVFHATHPSTDSFIHSYIPLYLFTYPFIHSFIHQSTHSLTHPSIFPPTHPSSTYPSTHPSSHNLTHPSTFPSIHSSTHPSSIHPLIHSSVHHLVYPSTYLPIHPAIYSFPYSWIRLPICLSTCPSIHPFTHLLIH